MDETTTALLFSVLFVAALIALAAVFPGGSDITHLRKDG